MAPTFKTGRCTRVLLNGVDLSLILNDSERSASADTAETTTYATSTGGCTTDKTYIVGQKDATVSFSGMVDASTDLVDQTIEAALGSTTEQQYTWGPGGSSVGGRAFLTRGLGTEFTVTSPAQDVVAVSASVQANLSRGGVWLISPSAPSTSTGALATVTERTGFASTASGGSTNGAVIHFHMLSSSTNSTGTVKAQHSTDGATWADLATFNYSSAAGAQRSTVSGAIKEKVRGIITAKSTQDPRLALALARHIKPVVGNP